MSIDSLSKSTNLHHAYIVSGSAEKGGEEVLKVLESRGVGTKGNPDLMALSFSELLVDSVRDTLLPFASLKPLGEKKYLVVSFSRANDAAQNALLKAVEESLGNTIFFFCVDAIGHVLPTLRSRCIAVSIGNQFAVGSLQLADASEFLKENYEKRLLRVEKMASYISKTQDRAPARSFVADLMNLVHEKKSNPRNLRDLLDADRYIRLQGSSAKSILSHLAVSLPRV